MSEGHIHFTSLINDPLWEAANWKGVAYLLTESGEDIPMLGLVFGSTAPAIELFTEWIARLGRDDEFEELRISIIEGPIPSDTEGYSVVITTEISGMLARAQSCNIDFDPTTIVFPGRSRRMPAGKSAFDLSTFKAQFQNHRRYGIIPVTLNHNGVTPHYDRAIEKTKIHFRQSKDVSRTDPDSFIYL